MPWIDEEIVKKAKEMDLMTYLRNYRPDELIKSGGNEYKLKSHPSLKLSNGFWDWHSRGIGGISAFSFLMDVEGMSLPEAVNEILGQVENKKPVYIPEAELRPQRKKLVIPEENNRINEMVYYLRDARGIDLDIIYAEYNKCNLYQTKEHNNVAFVGRDKDGNIKLVTLRGTWGNFKNTAEGSDRRYPYMLKAEGVRNNVVHLFEAPIDALSYATLMKQMGMDYTQHNLVAMCGVAVPKGKNIEESKVPTGVEQYLTDYPYTKTVCLHLDNDDAGRLASQALQIVLGKKGLKVIDQPPPEGYKDCNDFLLHGSVKQLITGNKKQDKSQEMEESRKM